MFSIEFEGAAGDCHWMDVGDSTLEGEAERIEELETLIEDQGEYISALEGENSCQAILIQEVTQRISEMSIQRNNLWRNNLILRNTPYSRKKTMDTEAYKKSILKILSDNLLNALRADRQATAEHAATLAGWKEWVKYKQEDGIVNPYNVGLAEEFMHLHRKSHNHMQAAYNYAVDLFVSDDK